MNATCAQWPGAASAGVAFSTIGASTKEPIILTSRVNTGLAYVRFGAVVRRKTLSRTSSTTCGSSPATIGTGGTANGAASPGETSTCAPPATSTSSRRGRAVPTAPSGPGTRQPRRTPCCWSTTCSAARSRTGGSSPPGRRCRTPAAADPRSAEPAEPGPVGETGVRHACDIGMRRCRAMDPETDQLASQQPTQSRTPGGEPAYKPYTPARPGPAGGRTMSSRAGRAPCGASANPRPAGTPTPHCHSPPSPYAPAPTPGSEQASRRDRVRAHPWRSR